MSNYALINPENTKCREVSLLFQYSIYLNIFGGSVDWLAGEGISVEFIPSIFE